MPHKRGYNKSTNNGEERKRRRNARGGLRSPQGLPGVVPKGFDLGGGASASSSGSAGPAPTTVPSQGQEPPEAITVTLTTAVTGATASVSGREGRGASPTKAQLVQPTLLTSETTFGFEKTSHTYSQVICAVGSLKQDLPVPEGPPISYTPCSFV